METIIIAVATAGILLVSGTKLVITIRDRRERKRRRQLREEIRREVDHRFRHPLI